MNIRCQIISALNVFERSLPSLCSGRYLRLALLTTIRADLEEEMRFVLVSNSESTKQPTKERNRLVRNGLSEVIIQQMKALRC